MMSPMADNNGSIGVTKPHIFAPPELSVVSSELKHAQAGASQAIRTAAPAARPEIHHAPSSSHHCSVPFVFSIALGGHYLVSLVQRCTGLRAFWGQIPVGVHCGGPWGRQNIHTVSTGRSPSPPARSACLREIVLRDKA
ncbi:unnamed protein product [Gadus morhua 'NCC']